MNAKINDGRAGDAQATAVTIADDPNTKAIGGAADGRSSKGKR